MKYKRVFGIIVMFIFLLSNVAPALGQEMSRYISEEQLQENMVILFEKSIDESNDTINESVINDTINDTLNNTPGGEAIDEAWRDKLTVDSKKLYDFLAEVTGTDNKHVIYEIVLMMNQQLNPNQRNAILAYVNADPATRHKLMTNSITGQTIGYVITQFKKWGNLSMKEKIALLDCNKHTMMGAFEVLTRATPTEVLWINGYIEQAPYGYGNYKYELDKMISLGTHASEDDYDRFNKAGNNLSETIFRAHNNYMLLESNSIIGFEEIIKNFMDSSDDLEKKIYSITILKEGINDVDNQLADLQDEFIVNGETMVSTGSGLILIGGVVAVVGFVVVGCSFATAAPVGGALIAIGLGAVIAGITLVAIGSPSLDNGIKLKHLREKLAPNIENFNKYCDIFINELKKNLPEDQI